MITCLRLRLRLRAGMCLGWQVAERDVPGSHPRCRGCAQGVGVAAAQGVTYGAPAEAVS